MTYPNLPPQAPAYAPAPARTDGMAVAALVLGCLFWLPFVGAVCAILATVFGWAGMRHTRSNSGLRGHGMAVAGFVLGLVGLVLAALIIVLIVVSAATTPGSSS